MQQANKNNTSDSGWERLPILLSDGQLPGLIAHISAGHAQLYSTYAGRLAVIVERLRWRARLQSNFDLTSDPAIITHLELLRTQSRSLNKQKTALENEQNSLIEQVNFLGYSVKWETGRLVVSPLPEI